MIIGPRKLDDLLLQGRPEIQTGDRQTRIYAYWFFILIDFDQTPESTDE